MTEIRRVGVVGAGTMGNGIAHVFARSGFPVVLAEVEQPALDRGLSTIEKNLAREVAKGKLTQGDADASRTRISGTLDRKELADCDLVVEAATERFAIKQALFQELDGLLGAEAILASNTSSISITRLAATTKRPDRVIGMHFFNPVPASALVEIVVGPRTAAGARESAQAWVAGLGKTEVVVRDSPGFATSRLGVLLGLEAIRMLEEGVADAAAIDRAMELGYRHPMGPLRSTDLVGLDVRLAIAEHLHRELGERFAPPRLLRDKVARGELGRKTGKGFFTWEAS